MPLQLDDPSHVLFTALASRQAGELHVGSLAVCRDVETIIDYLVKNGGPVFQEPRARDAI
jgi:hypothetical protein